MTKILKKKEVEVDLVVDQEAEVDPDLDLIAALVQEVVVIRIARVRNQAEVAVVQEAAQRKRRKRARKESSMPLTQMKRSK